MTTRDKDSQDLPHQDNLQAALSDAFDSVVPPPHPPAQPAAPQDAAPMDGPTQGASQEPAQQAFLDDDEDDESEAGGDGDDNVQASPAAPSLGDASSDGFEDSGAALDDPEEADRLAALSSDLDDEAPDEAPEGEIPVDRIDSDALKVVRRLHHFGYEAYLVGGCVRDLLLGRKPKDFDVATSAEPNQIRQIFRNCRLIGRRFRLAHVYFHGGKVVETSTFRANPLDEMDDLPKDLLISQDNVFGTSLEDARRRDFTVNALFYDPKTGKVVDHVGGRVDLDARVMRTIGDPEVRLREDPVRILRAVKFAARLGFAIDPATQDAMARHAGEIARCAAPRVLEEIYRLLASGAARPAFALLMELNIIPVLMPELAPALGFAVEGGPPPAENSAEMREELLQVLLAMDACKGRGVEPSHALSLAVLLWKMFLRLQNSGQDANRWLDDISMALVNRLRLTRRDRERLRLLMHAQRHLAPDRRRGSAARATVRRGPFLESLLLYTIHLMSTGGDLAQVGQWKAWAKAEGVAFRPGEVVDRPGMDHGRPDGPRGKRFGSGDPRRRRRRGRRP